MYWKWNKQDTRIVYVDDDWTYHERMLQVLYAKSLEYPNDALCLNGGILRSYFRQILPGLSSISCRKPHGCGY